MTLKPLTVYIISVIFAGWARLESLAGRFLPTGHMFDSPGQNKPNDSLKCSRSNRVYFSSVLLGITGQSRVCCAVFSLESKLKKKQKSTCGRNR